MFRNPALWFVLATVLIDAVGIGLMMPVMPALLAELGAGSLANAALWGGIMSTTFAAMQFLFGPLLGALSDRFGRRRVLLVSLFFAGVDYLVMGMAHAMWLLLLTRVVGGITAANHSTAAAVVADISPRAQKAANFGLLGAAFGIGFILGPVLGGVAAEFGPRAPFFLAGALALTLFAVGLRALPETLSEENRRPFDLHRAHPFGAIRALGRLPGQMRMLAVYFLHEFGFIVYPAVWSFYAIGRFGWEPWLIGLSLGAFGLGMAISQGVLIRRVVPVLGEARTLMLGLSAQALCLVGFAFAPATWFVFALLPLSALGLMAGPALQGIVSGATPANAQGELQGVMASTRAMAAITSPLVMTALYRQATADPSSAFHGAPFLLAAVLLLAALAVFATGRRGKPPPAA